MTASLGRTLSYLARHRAAAVGAAATVEVAALVALGNVDSSSSVGLPGAVAAAIGGTVAVVFGAADGAVVALLGAAAFGFAGGWGAGEFASLVVWPAVVAGAGLFARRVEARRAALQQVLALQELERKRIAFELHEEIAQTLAGAAMALQTAARESQDGPAAEALAHARELIRETIADVRELSIDLRPHTLDDFGVGAAVERLGALLTERSGVPVSVEVTGIDRLRPDVELALYRIAEEALDTAIETAPERVRLRITRNRGAIVLVVEKDGRLADPEAPGRVFDGVRERVRLLGGRLTVDTHAGRSVVVRAEIPLPAA